MKTWREEMETSLTKIREACLGAPDEIWWQYASGAFKAAWFALELTKEIEEIYLAITNDDVQYAIEDMVQEITSLVQSTVEYAELAVEEAERADTQKEMKAETKIEEREASNAMKNAIKKVIKVISQIEGAKLMRKEATGETAWEKASHKSDQIEEIINSWIKWPQDDFVGLTAPTKKAVL